MFQLKLTNSCEMIFGIEFRLYRLIILFERYARHRFLMEAKLANLFYVFVCYIDVGADLWVKFEMLGWLRYFLVAIFCWSLGLLTRGVLF